MVGDAAPGGRGRTPPQLAAVYAALVVVGVLALGGPAAFGSARDSTPVPTRFDPWSVTFVSSRTGWVLGVAPCSSGACLALRETTDAGRSWSARPLPASLRAAADHKVDGVLAGGAFGARLGVRFADPSDGWIYGGLVVPAPQGGMFIEPTLWSTHDGGLAWRVQHLRGVGRQDPIFDLEAAGGTVHLLAPAATYGVVVESSPVGEDRWHRTSTTALASPAGGGQQSGAIVLQGSSGWLVEGNDRGTTGSARLTRGGRWASWTPPCASVGHSFAIPAASTASDLVAVCVMGGFAYPLSPSAPRGATLGSSWLYLSNDGGETFKAGPELGPRTSSFGVLASPSPGVILVGRASGNSQKLEASFDSGAHWHTVYSGQVVFVGFTTPSQGVGVVRSPSGADTMIMSFDGGRRWSPVSL